MEPCTPRSCLVNISGPCERQFQNQQKIERIVSRSQEYSIQYSAVFMNMSQVKKARFQMHLYIILLHCVRALSMHLCTWSSLSKDLSVEDKQNQKDENHNNGCSDQLVGCHAIGGLKLEESKLVPAANRPFSTAAACLFHPSAETYRRAMPFNVRDALSMLESASNSYNTKEESDYIRSCICSFVNSLTKDKICPRASYRVASVDDLLALASQIRQDVCSQ